MAKSKTEETTESTIETGGASEAAAKKPAPTVASVLGEIAWLFAMTPSHRFFFMSDLEWLVMPPVIKQQFRIYRDENGRPVGLVLWAKMNEDAEERLMQGSSRIRPQDWDSGDRHWIVDVVDLTGGQRAQAMIDDMKTNVFKDTPFKFHRTDASGNRTVVDSAAD